MNRLEDPDVITMSGEDETYMYLSEKAERRLGWIMTGLLILATLPVFVIAFLM